MSKWINVYDRLPKHLENVIIAVKSDYGNGDIEIDVCAGKYINFENDVLDEAIYNIKSANRIGGFDIYENLNEGQPIEVTHWMPMPEPPNKEDKEQQIEIKHCATCGGSATIIRHCDALGADIYRVECQNIDCHKMAHT
jgi:hypothetical protein